MGSINISVILIFVVFIFVCGIGFSKTGKNKKPYLSVGDALPVWMSRFSPLMGFSTVGTIVVRGADREDVNPFCVRDHIIKNSQGECLVQNRRELSNHKYQHFRYSCKNFRISSKSRTSFRNRTCFDI